MFDHSTRTPHQQRPNTAGSAHTASLDTRLRVAGAAGILVLPLFVCGVVLLTWLEWDYVHSTGWTVLDDNEVNYPSVLARGPLGALASVNFLVMAALMFVLGRGLGTQFVHRRSGLVALAGFVMLGLSGPFSAFFTDLPGEDGSWHGAQHALGFVLLMLGLIVAQIASGVALRGAAHWGGYPIYCLVNPPAAILLSVVLSRFGQVSFYAFLTLLLAWFAVMGLRLRRLDHNS
jgi:hypothetical protein